MDAALLDAHTRFAELLASMQRGRALHQAKAGLCIGPIHGTRIAIWCRAADLADEVDRVAEDVGVADELPELLRALRSPGADAYTPHKT